MVVPIKSPVPFLQKAYILLLLFYHNWPQATTSLLLYCKRIWKIVGIVLLTILALNLLLAIFGMSAYTSFSTDGKTTVIEMNEDSVSYEE